MKFKTFRNIVIVVAVVAVGGSLAFCGKCISDSAEQAKLERQRIEEEERKRAEQAARDREAFLRAEADRVAAADAQAKADAQARLDNPVAFVASAPGLSESDLDVLTALQRPVTDKIKDATAGKKWKVNVYADDKQRFNRAKVDLDRDGRWDESWTVKPDGNVEKKVAAADDEKYGDAQRLDKRTGWVTKAMEAPAATTTAPPDAPASAASGALSASDSAMLSLIKRMTVTDKIKDATKGQPYKINLYSDDGKAWNRAKVDLNRNEKWDESWTFKDGGVIEKKVAPADDESYSVVYVLAPSGTSWTKK